jgi:methylated-DNA-[protein]-cysteine S-methyltransferase
LNGSERIELIGTDFEIKVWSELKKIPYGEVRTYKQIAELVGSQKSYRAVANACGKNPHPPLIPCHRVLRSDGSLGGYSGAGGVSQKKKLLIQEGVFTSD